MPGETRIEWATDTWNPVTGCSKVSPGCAHCYAEKLSRRFGRSKLPWTPANAAENVVLHQARLDVPLKWRRPRMIFVNSMSDLFHDQVPDEFIARIFAMMMLCSRHVFQVLTKRPERMRRLLSSAAFVEAVYAGDGGTPIGQVTESISGDPIMLKPWPLSNVWLGVSAENQRWADERIPVLLDTPAAVRWVSIEPLLGPIDLEHLDDGAFNALDGIDFESLGDIRDPGVLDVGQPDRGLDWVVVGGESAGPARRRLVDGPFDVIGHPRYLPSVQGHDWVSSLRDQCVAAGVPFFFKQWGGPTPKSGGRLLDGREWNEMPGRIEVRL